MDVKSIHFDRKPYTVQYRDFHTGELITVQRRPPEKLHDILPTDVVELSFKKNDDWQAGENYTVKQINSRDPNTLQLQKDDGETTFINSQDAILKIRHASRSGDKIRVDDSVANQYLLWP